MILGADAVQVGVDSCEPTKAIISPMRLNTKVVEAGEGDTEFKTLKN